MGILAFSGFLQRLVRVDSPTSQGTATVRLVWDALERGDARGATDLAAYLIQEQGIGHEIFARWTERMVQYIITHATHTLRDVHAATMRPWLSTTTTPYFSDVASHIPALDVSGEEVR